eukprot:6492636-Prymnesium_polylepis.1
MAGGAAQPKDGARRSDAKGATARGGVHQRVEEVHDRIDRRRERQPLAPHHQQPRSCARPP